jgi:class 3 adenylate cyclase
MKSVFRYRKERHFAQPPEAIWPFVADTARINELAGSPPYKVEERADADGRIRRFATARVGPLKVHWEESFSEWQENRRLTQTRLFRGGPIGLFKAGAELEPEGAGTRLVSHAEIECLGLLGLIVRYSGQLGREGDKRLAAIERLIADSAAAGRIPGESVRDELNPAARRRLETLAAGLAADPAIDPEARALAPKLVEFLSHAPAVALRGIRPLALAKLWQATPERAVELFLAAERRGIVAMGWDLLCPRCRGAKSRAAHLHDLPRGAHCSSCNIDYGRNFSRNVELTFRPMAWLRALPEGELCLLGQVPHVRFQAEVAARSGRALPLSLPPGPYRFRTIEAGGEADAELGADGALPEVRVAGDGIRLDMPGRIGELVLHNDTDRPLFFVVEDRAWAADALTGERVIAMPAFRRLHPEQLLRPGDDAEIGRVAIMFTDLQGSTRLYDELGDAPAFRLVRDHFAYLSERVARHDGFIVKTVGDAVMAAFHDPADGIRAALAIQDEVAGFNAKHGGEAPPIVLKLGLHAGSCIAVTTADLLDYFGAAVNIASRLEHQCRGGEIIVSDAVLEDEGARDALAGRSVAADKAALRGVSEPVGFIRVVAATLT